MKIRVVKRVEITILRISSLARPEKNERVFEICIVYNSGKREYYYARDVVIHSVKGG